MGDMRNVLLLFLSWVFIRLTMLLNEPIRLAVKVTFLWEAFYNLKVTRCTVIHKLYAFDIGRLRNLQGVGSYFDSTSTLKVRLILVIFCGKLSLATSGLIILIISIGLAYFAANVALFVSIPLAAYFKENLLVSSITKSPTWNSICINRRFSSQYCFCVAWALGRFVQT